MTCQVQASEGYESGWCRGIDVIKMMSFRRVGCRSGQKLMGIHHQAHECKDTHPGDEHPQGIEYEVTSKPFHQSVHALDTALYYIYFIG